ncbi:MAG: hypothetical protein GX483_07930 [Actinomycetaceae bacterium]|nr:hypothetical protein [Actinomycetaceae bacterium]
MRTLISLGAGASAVLLLLAGCASEEEDSATASASTEPSVIDYCTDPLAGNPETVSAQELAFCQAEAVGTIAGYVQEDYYDDVLVSTSRVNIDPLAVEIKGTSGTETEDGSWIILVVGKTFVNVDGHWIEAHANSDDEVLQYQATFPQRFEAMLNPHLRALATNADLQYDVVGTEVVSGYETTVLSLTVEDPETGAMSVNQVYVRDDYITVLSETTTTSETGEQHTRKALLTEIDVAQEIVNPMYAEVPE